MHINKYPYPLVNKQVGIYKFMVGPVGFEPTTLRLKVQGSKSLARHLPGTMLHEWINVALYVP